MNIYAYTLLVFITLNSVYTNDQTNTHLRPIMMPRDNTIYIYIYIYIAHMRGASM